MAPLKNGPHDVPAAFSKLAGSPILSAIKNKAQSLMKGGKKGKDFTVDYDPYTDPDWWNQGYIYGGVVPRDG